jgi:predicted PurR-regulated permease PerM
MNRQPVPVPRRPWALLDYFAGLAWRFLVIAAALALVVFVLLQLKVVVVPLLLALLVSSILQPVVGWLRGKGLSQATAAILTLLGALLVMAGVLAVLLPALFSQMDDVVNSVNSAMDDIYKWLEGPPVNLSDSQLDSLRSDVSDAGPETGGLLLDGISAALPVFFQVVGVITFTIIFTGYILGDGDRYWRWMLGFVDPERHDVVNQLGRNAYGTLANYIRGTAAVATVDSVFIGVGLLILGVPQAIPIAVLVFFGAFLPIIGAWLVGIVAVLIALADGGIELALAVAALILIVQQLEGTFLQPFLVGHKVNLAPIVTLATVTAGTALAGIVGGILAVPLVATISGALAEVRRWRTSAPPTTDVASESG